MKKNKVIIIIICVLVVIALGIIFLVNTKKFRGYLAQKDIRKMAGIFYGYYYEENNYDKDIKKYLKDYEKSGLSITLGDLEIYLEARTGNKPNYKSLEKCDRAKSKVVTYPKEPFNKDSYDLKFELICK